MAFGGPSQGEMRLALSELLRREMGEDGGQDVRFVTGWWDSSRERYPGTSSMWVEHSITVGYRDWSGEYKTFQVDDVSEERLIQLLANVVEDYGNER